MSPGLTAESGDGPDIPVKVGWQLRLDLLVEMFKRFCYMSKLWDFESQLYQCILYADFE